MVDMNDLTTFLRPAEQAHVAHLIEGLLRGRLRVINVWRPLNEGSVQDFPLALCDGSSILEEDLVECDHIRRKFFGATMYAAYRSTQRWYYLSKQRQDEITLIKIFDSRSIGVQARCCPHGSFKHPRCPDEAEPRSSIEVRALEAGDETAATVESVHTQHTSSTYSSTQLTIMKRKGIDAAFTRCPIRSLGLLLVLAAILPLTQTLLSGSCGALLVAAISVPATGLLVVPGIFIVLRYSLGFSK
ncbi:hypothetical protein B0T19DRAFT_488379 [Cercophora scortea]|uniref:Uncharacterized protein n=1 Tax=Cercophora scortea TaxID=314031 RepID=A0AAE0M5P0_9PEZI|nr:hypothetical protein B0T19DRAFT_488379 [Cercophora scortea]